MPKQRKKRMDLVVGAGVGAGYSPTDYFKIFLLKNFFEFRSRRRSRSRSRSRRKSRVDKMGQTWVRCSSSTRRRNRKMSPIPVSAKIVDKFSPS